MGTSNADSGILEELKALNKSWCTSISPDKEETSNVTDAKSNGKEEADPKKKKAPLTPLVKARNAISKLPPSSDSIVPYLFSALNKTTKDVNKTPQDATSAAPSSQSPTDMEKDSENNFKLRQMEWHVVLVLELLCASQSRDGLVSMAAVLDALVASIRLYREEQSRTKHKKLDKKKKKKKKRKRKASPQILSQEDKEKLLLDHLIEVLSRAPFLLPRTVPLSQFLNTNILSDKILWASLPNVVSHIYQAFEIPNPHLKKPKDRSLLLGSSVLDPNIVVDSTERDSAIPKASKKKNVDSEASKKRKTEKLQNIAKTKKRQRLASLTSKKKHRGSHFHRNLDDISKLLDKNQSKSALSANRDKSKLGRNDKSTALKERKSNTGNSKSKLSAKAGRTETNKLNPDKNQKSVRSKRPLNATVVRRNDNIDDLLADPMAKRSSTNDKIANGNPSRKSSNSNESTTVETLPMTPRRKVRSDAESRIISETPVPSSSGRRMVVGETPVPADRTTVAETPTYDNRFGSTPISSAPFFSPPPLPSPMTLPTPSVEETTKQPVKLFGLLKRTNSITSRGRMETGMKGGAKNRAPSTSSIDKGLAFLRSKST